MKTAVIITGHIRSLDQCLPNIRWMVLRHYPGAHFFVSTVKDADSHKAELLRKFYEHVEIEAVDSQPDFPGLPKWTPGAFCTHEPYAISVPPLGVVRQLWQLQKGLELFQRSGFKPDIVIRLRPDLWFHQFYPVIPMQNEAHTPWWGRFGGCNDRFSVMDANCATHYFGTFNKMERLIMEGCPLHPESLLRASLEDGKCIIYDTLDAEFSTVRVTGQLRPPEILHGDLRR